MKVVKIYLLIFLSNILIHHYILAHEACTVYEEIDVNHKNVTLSADIDEDCALDILGEEDVKRLRPELFAKTFMYWHKIKLSRKVCILNKSSVTTSGDNLHLYGNFLCKKKADRQLIFEMRTLIPGIFYEAVVDVTLTWAGNRVKKMLDHKNPILYLELTSQKKTKVYVIIAIGIVLLMSLTFFVRVFQKRA